MERYGLAQAMTIMTIDPATALFLAPVGGLHPMQQAFHEQHGLQCGFCTPGMIMSAVDFARVNPKPSPEAVRNGLEGNICRCTGYQNIVASVIAGAGAMHANAKGA